MEALEGLEMRDGMISMRLAMRSSLYKFPEQ